jgi:hypothetical protein
VAKLQYIDGQVIPKDWINSIYGSGATGGHRHDGADSDGHSGKINLNNATDVDGVLPHANIDWDPMRGHIDGFRLAYVDGDSDSWQLTIGYGACRSDANDALIQVTARTKNIIDAAGTAFVEWSAGDAAGGVFSGVTIGTQWLHVFAINDPANNLHDIGLDSSVIAANRPAAYTKYRRVGSIYIESLGGGKYGIKKFIQRGDRFMWEAYNADYDGTINGGTVYEIALSVPPDVSVVGRIAVSYYNATAGRFLNLSTGLVSGNPREVLMNSNASTLMGEVVAMELVTNTSRQIKALETGDDTTSHVTVHTAGWIDYRGRDA